jgi:FtsH-binding integral membrane protein
MAVFGLIIASVFKPHTSERSSYDVYSFAGVLIFSGLTAYDTQYLKNVYAMRPSRLSRSKRSPS